MVNRPRLISFINEIDSVPWPSGELWVTLVLIRGMPADSVDNDKQGDWLFDANNYFKWSPVRIGE